MEQLANTTQSGRARWVALIIVCLGQLMMVLDATIVNVALPAIQKDLHFSQASLTWVVNAYLVAFGSFLLMAGRLGDLIGRKRVFLGGLALFTAASVACGLATDQAVLITARFIQGLGGAVATSVILAIIVTEFPEARERAKAISLYTFVAVAGGSIGLLAGGVLTQSISWHWIFFINVPVGIAALLLGFRYIKENEGIGLRQGVDWLGSVLVTAAMMVGVYAIVTSTDYGWLSAHTLGFGAGAIALLATFFAWEARIPNPIFPLRVLRLRGLIGSSAVRGFLVTGMFTSFFLGALYLEHVLGYGAVDTGLAFLPMTLIVGALSLGVTAKLVARFGAKPVLLVGLSLATVGLLLLARPGVDAGYFPDIAVALTLTGLGAGMAFLPLLTIAMADVPQRDAGLASGIVNVSVQISAALGLAVLGTIATDHTKSLTASGHSVADALTSGYHLSFVIAAACVAFGALLAVFVLPSPRREPATAPPAREPARAPEAEVQPSG
jgi:EmrB/QacA subfamily drug resistance transporter